MPSGGKNPIGSVFFFFFLMEDALFLYSSLFPFCEYPITGFYEDVHPQNLVELENIDWTEGE